MIYRINRIQAGLALLGLGLAFGLCAQENRLKWHGFLSVGGGMTLHNDEVYMADYPSNAMYDDRMSYSADTMLGLQVQADVGDDLSATAQIIARGGEDFNAKFEWAYLSYELTDELVISAGRRRYPLFYFSETLDLGYSYHWIRPPIEVYSQALTSYEGVSVRHKTTLGVFDSKLDIWGGRTQADVPTQPGVEMDLTDMGGIAWKVGYNEQVNARLIYSFASIDFSNGGVVFDARNDTKFYGAALALDMDSWFLISEYTTIQIENTWNNAYNWYVSAGVRIGAFTPHITAAESKERRSTTPAEEQRSVTVGVRYDFHPQAAVKLEFSTVQDRSDPPESVNGDSDLISVAIDITF